jgi:polysaccharide biosynthesis/export protein
VRVFLTAMTYFYGVIWAASPAIAQAKASEAASQAQGSSEKASSARSATDVPKQEKGTASAPKSAKTLDYDPATYMIGPDDQLMIAVWHEPELSLSLVVRPDGMITLPLVNDVHAGGLKPLELQALLTEKLKPFVNEPQVTVIVQAIRSRKVFIAGQGAKAGAFPLNGRVTVLELLVQAGGLGPFAKVKSIYVLRTINGRQTRIPFNYKEALSGRAKSDIYLEPGDVVVVP